MIKTFYARCTVLAIASAILALLLTARPLQAAAPGSGELPYADSADEHFHPKGKPPSEHTLAVIRKARETMPFEDVRDFAEAEKGFIAH